MYFFEGGKEKGSLVKYTQYSSEDETKQGKKWENEQQFRVSKKPTSHVEVPNPPLPGPASKFHVQKILR